MISEARLDRVLDRIYAAALDATQWGGALSELAQMFASRVGTLELHDSTRQRLVFFDSVGVESRDAEDYGRHYARVNPRVKPLFGTTPGTVHCDYSWFSEHELGRFEFYEDFLARQDLKYYVGATLVSGAGRYGVIALVRPRRLQHVDTEELDTMRLLVPHLRRALEITTRLNHRNARAGDLREVLSRLAVGVALVDASRRVVYVNDAARDALGARGPLGVEGGVLTARRRRDQHRLSSCLESAILGQGGPPSVVLGEGPEDAVTVTVCPLPGPRTLDGLFAAPPQEWLAMVTLEPARTVKVALGPLQDLGLAPAEARLAVSLAEGRSLAEYAAARRVSINTVRTHLARLKSKLDCNTQAGVVRRVFELLPSVRERGG